jgi:hypothetical protein
MPISRARLLFVIVAAAVIALTAAAPAGAAKRAVSAYAGLGTWIDIYDKPAFDRPIETVAAIAARGVRTIYLETSNYRQTTAILRPAATGRLIEAAHAAGIEVVSWYLPSFRKISRDLTRSLTAIRFRTAGGEAFDGFALDIESPLVAPAELRTTRLLTLSRMLREKAPKSYTLGAIIPSPRGMQLSPTYWPGFPYADLGRIYDVFLPMSYFTYRVEGGSAVRAYTAKSISIIRDETGRPGIPIHMIGGVADGTSAVEAGGFMQAIARCKPLGYSLYDYHTTSAAAWAKLASIPAASGACR